jgi:hypothetical protein
LSAHFVSIASAVERRTRQEMEKTLVRVLFDNPAARGGRQDTPDLPLDRYDRSEIDPPTSLQMFTPFGALLVIALAFGLAAELLIQAPTQ